MGNHSMSRSQGLILTLTFLRLRGTRTRPRTGKCLPKLTRRHLLVTGLINFCSGFDAVSCSNLTLSELATRFSSHRSIMRTHEVLPHTDFVGTGSRASIFLIFLSGLHFGWEPWWFTSYFELKFTLPCSFTYFQGSHLRHSGVDVWSGIGDRWRQYWRKKLTWWRPTRWLGKSLDDQKFEVSQKKTRVLIILETQATLNTGRVRRQWKRKTRCRVLFQTTVKARRKNVENAKMKSVDFTVGMKNKIDAMYYSKVQISVKRQENPKALEIGKWV